MVQNTLPEPAPFYPPISHPSTSRALRQGPLDDALLPHPPRRRPHGRDAAAAAHLRGPVQSAAEALLLLKESHSAGEQTQVSTTSGNH